MGAWGNGAAGPTVDGDGGAGAGGPFWDAHVEYEGAVVGYSVVEDVVEGVVCRAGYGDRGAGLEGRGDGARGEEDVCDAIYVVEGP